MHYRISNKDRLFFLIVVLLSSLFGLIEPANASLGKDSVSVYFSHWSTREARMSDGYKWTDLIDPFVTLLGIIIAACMIKTQMSTQHKNTLKEQDSQNKTGLKIQIFQEAMDSLYQSIRSVAIAGGSALGQRAMLANLMLDSPGEPTISIPRVADGYKLSFDYFRDMDNALVEVIIAIERYKILTPGMEAAIWAFSSTQHDLHRLRRSLDPLLIEVLYRNNAPDSVETPTKMVDRTKMKALVIALQEMESKISEIQSYQYDVIHQLQNILLGPLFERKLPDRVPLDSSLHVLSFDEDKLEEQRAYFFENTDWGISLQRSKRKVEDSSGSG